jgi:CRISPR-associated endonuclease/helicase Cas3
MVLTRLAKALWAKSPNKYGGTEQPEGSWLPLHLHMSDSVEIAKYLWDYWIPPGTKDVVGKDHERGRRTFLFLAGAHDVGKATPAFQSKNSELLQNVLDLDLIVEKMNDPSKAPHDLAGHIIIQKFLRAAPLNYSKFDADMLAVVVGGHHGISPDVNSLMELTASWKENTGIGNPGWDGVQRELFDYAVFMSGIDLLEMKNEGISVPAQAILTGLVIMTDWLASDEKLFSYCGDEFQGRGASAELAAEAWDNLQLPPYWISGNIDAKIPLADFFRSRFDLPPGSKPRPIQQAVVEVLQNAKSPGIVVIEAPMGEGKTEAALLAAEIMAASTGRGGAFIGLPTQATTDGIFPRVEEWIKRIDTENHSLYLAHGKAEFNDAFQNLARISGSTQVWDDGSEANAHYGAVAHDWMQGRKKGILSDFVVGTVDQVLMAALRQRHLALRHLGFANKAVIIDEVHAYDSYMYQYLEMALQWLGAYGVPVIILSATLPAQKRKALVDAYLNCDSAQAQDLASASAYPLITYTDKENVRYREVESSGRNLPVEIEFIEDGELIDVLDDYLSDGGCACVICNTVKRAQQTARELAGRFGGDFVELFHSQFLSADRIEKEKNLRFMLGRDGANRPPKYIVVGTQVLEQSLDVDFDFMITDIAPVDLLLQRIGRLHRHERGNRPHKLKQARCLILGADMEDDLPKFERGSEIIYGRYLLERTFARVRDVQIINLPDDISDFVQYVYCESDDIIPEAWQEDYAEAKQEQKRRTEKKTAKAKVFRLHNVGENDTLIDWINTRADDSDAQGEASVRDTSDSLEVVVVQKKKNEAIHLLPWIGAEIGAAGAEIPIDQTPDDSLTGVAASCTVKLPGILCAPWMIDSVIMELEANAKNSILYWQNSKWLRGALILMLDEALEATVCGYRLTYNKNLGLSAEEIK